MAKRLLMILLMGVLCATVWRLSPAIAQGSPSQPTTKPFKSVADEYLHNAYIVTDKVISGAQPEGDIAFKELSEMGVKTIISVDGAAPDVEAAKKYGIRYVHLPIGYDGVSEERGQEIAKAIDELPGKIYVHCHHGKHRSASAVAVACVFNGTLKPERAESVLETFGTGANYKGLWKAALTAKPMGAAALKAVQVKYVEVAKIDDLAERMVQVDQHWEHIKEIQKAGWKAPANHPDLDPPHEALQAEEHLRESARLKAVAEKPEAFRKLLAEGEASVKSLGAVLTSGPIDVKAADAAFATATANCAACHKAYRD